MATREGVCQAVFLEGGLSSDGRLQKPKLGLVDYMLRSFDPDVDRDIVFIPVGINYDRTLEDRSLLRSLDPSAEKRSWWFVSRTVSGFILRSLMLMVLNRWRSFGYACVNFGKPLSVKTYCRAQELNFSKLLRNERFPEVEKLCLEMMGSISEVVPIVPLSLVATVFLEAGDTPMDILQVQERSHHLIETLRFSGGPILETSHSARAQAIVEAVEVMLVRRMITASGDMLKTVSGEEEIIRYYANSIAHWIARPSQDDKDFGFFSGMV
jgi:glycerol-3-phosphate O-acyltransferase